MWTCSLVAPSFLPICSCWNLLPTPPPTPTLFPIAVIPYQNASFSTISHCRTFNMIIFLLKFNPAKLSFCFTMGKYVDITKPPQRAGYGNKFECLERCGCCHNIHMYTHTEQQNVPTDVNIYGTWMWNEINISTRFSQRDGRGVFWIPYGQFKTLFL